MTFHDNMCFMLTILYFFRLLLITTIIPILIINIIIILMFVFVFVIVFMFLFLFSFLLYPGLCLSFDY